MLKMLIFIKEKNVKSQGLIKKGKNLIKKKNFFFAPDSSIWTFRAFLNGLPEKISPP